MKIQLTYQLDENAVLNKSHDLLKGLLPNEVLQRRYEATKGQLIEGMRLPNVFKEGVEYVVALALAANLLYPHSYEERKAYIEERSRAIHLQVK